jgi:hypothetical protein
MARAALGLGVVLAVMLVSVAHGVAQAAPDAAPAGYDALYEQATNELGTGNWAGAQALFTQAHELYPNATTLRGLGIAALELGQYDRAASLLERALASGVRPLSPALRAQTEAALARARAGAPAAAPPPPPSAPLPPAPAYAAPPPPPPPSRDDSYIEPEERPRHSSVAGSLGVSAVLPMEGYAEQTRGMGITAGVWVQRGHLVFEPRIGTFWDVADESRGYFHLPVQLGTYALLPFGDHALFIGPGAGVDAIFERIEVSKTVGSAVVASTHDTLHDDAFGFEVFGRAGFVLMRTSLFSLVPSVEYGVTFADLVKARNEQALRISLAVLMGGGGR